MTDRARDYWDRRYTTGGTSGPGSIGPLGRWKREAIERYAGPLDDVVDVGCGDLSFWRGDLPARYTGIDISPAIVRRNRTAYPDRRWICANADTRLDISGRVVCCLDLLFHIMDDTEYTRALENLCRYADEWIAVYTWRRNPIHGGAAADWYQCYRTFSDYAPIFAESGFRLRAIRTSEADSVGALWLYRKGETA